MQPIFTRTIATEECLRKASAESRVSVPQRLLLVGNLLCVMYRCDSEGRAARSTLQAATDGISRVASAADIPGHAHNAASVYVPTVVRKRGRPPKTPTKGPESKLPRPCATLDSSLVMLEVEKTFTIYANALQEKRFGTCENATTRASSSQPAQTAMEKSANQEACGNLKTLTLQQQFIGPFSISTGR